MKLTGNTLLITGGSSGIGFALAKRFWKYKNKVIITGRNKEKLQQIKRDFPGIEILAGNLVSKDFLNELVFFIEENHSGLNILVNNAAVQYNYQFTDTESNKACVFNGLSGCSNQFKLEMCESKA